MTSWVIRPMCHGVFRLIANSTLSDARQLCALEYLRLAEIEETVLVSDRDRVVAEIVPPEPSNHTLYSADYLIGSCQHVRRNR